jgi:hypothetical protein
MSSPEYRTSDVSGWVGWIAFAAFFMIIAGVLGIIQGLTAVIRDDAPFFTKNALVIFDLTQWGWVHFIFGIILVLVGLALMKGATWARVVAVLLVGLHLISQFAALPWYPVWAVIAIVIDMLVLWALLVHGGETKALDAI